VGDLYAHAVPAIPEVSAGADLAELIAAALDADSAGERLRDGQIVTIADKVTKGLIIYYTTNGKTPSTSSTKYTSAGIKVTATETIKVIAIATGYSQSAVASAKYTVN